MDSASGRASAALGSMAQIAHPRGKPPKGRLAASGAHNLAVNLLVLIDLRSELVDRAVVSGTAVDGCPVEVAR